MLRGCSGERAIHLVLHRRVKCEARHKHAISVARRPVLPHPTLLSVEDKPGTCTWAVAPASAPEMRRCTGVMSRGSATSIRLMWSFAVSLIAVSGVILITFVPFPRKNARSVPAKLKVILACMSVKKTSYPVQVILVRASGSPPCRQSEPYLKGAAAEQP